MAAVEHGLVRSSLGAVFTGLLPQQPQQLVQIPFADTQQFILAKGLMLEEWTDVFLFCNGSLNPPIPLLIASKNERPKAAGIIFWQSSSIR
jgi:hypothetical protein